MATIMKDRIGNLSKLSDSLEYENAGDDDNNANDHVEVSSNLDTDFDSSRHSQQQQKKNDETNSESTFLGRETRQVKGLRRIVMIMLIATAVVSCWQIYRIIRKGQVANFHTTFHDQAIKVINTFQWSVEQKLHVVDSLSISITSYANLKDKSWPMISIPDFHVLGSSTRSLSDAVSISFAPIVTKDQRYEWETYTKNNNQWIENGQQFEQLIATKRGTVNGTSASSRLLGLLSAAGSTGTTGHPRGLKLVEDDQQVISSQISYISDHKKVPSSGDGPYMPLWQSSPVVPELVNFDLLSSDQFYSGLQAMLASKAAVIGEVTDLSEENDVFQAFQEHWKEEAGVYGNDPVSKLYFPVFNRLQKGQANDIMGALMVVIFWESFLLDILPPGSPPIDVVLQNTCGQEYTYEVIGQDVIYLGPGDRHHQGGFSDDMVITSAAFDLAGLHESGDRYYGVPLSDYCHYSLLVYPTQEMVDEYINLTPWYFVITVAAIFLFSMFVIYCYDCQVDLRQKMVMEKVETAGAIVNSIFPESVTRRLFQRQQGNNGSIRGDQDSLRAQRRSFDTIPMFSEPQKAKLKSFLHEKSPESPDETDLPAHHILTKHHSTNIADTFTDTTILFAEIHGFAAWSSQRDPQQVFTLLETLYREFDMLAKKARVYKIETIGDSYLAATGLPEPQADHAVRMAKFARLCMIRMNEMTSEMEVTLGPDTGDLQLRVGMHSGPVTAGVLKGEQARFQLFGDTVNTASRMESNGIKNRIHCSEATANLLKLAGKEHWVKMRDEMIQVKGKGKVATYWVKPRNSPGSAAGEVNDSIDVVVDDAGDDSSDVSSIDNSSRSANNFINDAMIIDVAAWDSSSRLKRLVDYNVNLLASYLKQIEARRIDAADGNNGFMKQFGQKDLPTLSHKDGSTALDEVTEFVRLPKFDDHKRGKKKTSPSSVQLDPMVLMELKDYVTTIASMYRDNPFHGFEHASHVSQSTSKMLKRIVLSDEMDHLAEHQISALDLHDYSFGIATDPLTQFALIFCALIHDVDHPGVTNGVLIQESTPIAKFYKNKSVAEQNSVDLAWLLLMDSNYSHLQRAIYRTESELKRFRQLVVNIIMATDIFDKDMKAMRESRWEKAFDSNDGATKTKKKNFHGGTESDESTEIDDPSTSGTSSKSTGTTSYDDRNNLKATIVMEHLIQSSDVAHTMQHFDIYIKWNERLFREMQSAYDAGRGGMMNDPSKSWYEGEIGFFDRYIIPLATKLGDCGVFGVSSDEYLNFAKLNRKEWANRGDQLVKDFIKRYNDTKKKTTTSSSKRRGSIGNDNNNKGGSISTSHKNMRSNSVDFEIIPEDV